MRKIYSFLFFLVLIYSLSDIGYLYSQDKSVLSKGRKYIMPSVNFKKWNPPTDSLVIANLEKWKNNKIGVLITWGVFTQWNIIDSWTLCSYDAGWNHRTGQYADDYDTYKKQYERIYTYFNPVNFNPDLWAVAFKNAGIRYLLAMTKHLDGFCQYNTQTTDYKITSPNCPFHTNARSNIAYEILKAGRNQGLSVGAYFSKSDWNSNNFWWRYFGVTWLDVNYNTSQYPDRWSDFKSFTFNQIDEVTRNLGKLDILWLDGSWVMQGSNMDINMPAIATNARNNQPGLIIVDRVGGQFEDYLTPEYDIPAEPQSVPWELVTPMSPWWGEIPGMYYYSTDSLIHTMVEVFSKGGNILWGLGPDKNGVLEPECYQRLQEMGSWINVNGNAVYGTTYAKPFKSNNVYFTAKKDSLFAIYVAYNRNTIPSQISWSGNAPKPGTNIYMMGYSSPLIWETNTNGVTIVNIPYQLQMNPPCQHAWTIKYIKSKTR